MIDRVHRCPAIVRYITPAFICQIITRKSLHRGEADLSRQIDSKYIAPIWPSLSPGAKHEIGRPWEHPPQTAAAFEIVTTGEDKAQRKSTAESTTLTLHHSPRPAPRNTAGQRADDCDAQ